MEAETWEVKRRDYQRPRDARVALIRCGECKEYYETSVRQARRIQKGETRRLCETCRRVETAQPCTPDQTEEYADWWLHDSGLSRHEVIEIASMVHPGAARRSVPIPSPSRRMTSEEGHRTASTGVGAIRISGLGLTVNVSTAA